MRPTVMRPILFASIALLICSVVTAAKDKSLGEMQQEAQSATLKEQPKLYIKIAQSQLRLADKAFSVGNSASAQVAVDNVTEFATKAADTAIQSGKRLKDTEIDIRKIADKLRDIKRTLNFDDQAPVQRSRDKLEDLRSKLLASMFTKKKK
ncbi:MAG TPA: hypothetical protein VN684_03110 [Terriglobales bacterium]|nr:hypothetical protein [Terriglobales bacterium]